MAHSEAGPAARLPRSAGGIVTIIAGAAGTTLVALDMATSGDPHAAEWLVLLVPVFLGLGLLAAAPAMLAFRLRADSRWAQSGALAGSLAILVNVVSSTCPNLLYRLGGEQVAAVLAPLFPTVPAPLLAAGAGLVLAGVFSYLNRYAWVASVGLGLGGPGGQPGARRGRPCAAPSSRWPSAGRGGPRTRPRSPPEAESPGRRRVSKACASPPDGVQVWNRTAGPKQAVCTTRSWWALAAPARRQRCCSPRCRQAAYRARHR
jgi:hypothetical protein